MLRTLGEWVWKAEIDTWKRAGVPREMADRLNALERERRALCHAKAMLRQASADVAQPPRGRCRSSVRAGKGGQSLVHGGRASSGEGRRPYGERPRRPPDHRCFAIWPLARRGLESVVRGKAVRTTVRRKSAARPFDFADRKLHAPAPCIRLVSDLTYLPTRLGCVQVAFVIDVHARRIAGWHVSRTPAEKRLVHHPDRARHTSASATPGDWLSLASSRLVMSPDVV